MTDIVVPPEWKRLRIEDLCATVLIVGASDTGKTTLARYLFERLCGRGVLVAFLDLDVGQGCLGPPTMMTAALAAGRGDERFPPQGERASFFVGATTPRGHMLPMVVGAHRLQQKALELGAEAIVVDTTGLVDKGEGGRALKHWKIELLAPSVVIGIERSGELEPILWPLRRERRVRSVELPVSPYVAERTREARIARRRERLASYFEGALPQVAPLREAAVYGLERMTVGSLVAFQDAEGFALGLGAVEQVDRLARACIVRTPLLGMEGVCSVRFGMLRWDLVNQQEL